MDVDIDHKPITIMVIEQAPGSEHVWLWLGAGLDR